MAYGFQGEPGVFFPLLRLLEYPVDLLNKFYKLDWVHFILSSHTKLTQPITFLGCHGVLSDEGGI